jgi:hypothetical protein
MWSEQENLSMDPTRRSSWRVDLLLGALLLAFGASCFLIWHWRAPWYVADTRNGYLPDHCGPYSAAFVGDSKNRTLYFPDTGTIYQFPQNTLVVVHQLSPDRRYGICPLEGGGRLWDFAENREIPIPTEIRSRWWPADDWKRLFGCNEEFGAPRIYQVCSIDGSVLWKLVLPAIAPPKKSDKDRPVRVQGSTFSEHGTYMIEWSPIGDPRGHVRIYEMATGRCRPLEETPLDILDDGIALLKTEHSLRGVDLNTGRDRWAIPSIVDAATPSEGRLLARLADRTIALFDPHTGVRLATLEDSHAHKEPLSRIGVFKLGPRPCLSATTLWDLETGRKLPYEKPSFYPLEPLSDKRTALRANYGQGAVPEIVDLETGRTLHRFEHVPGYARGSGNVVLTYAASIGDQILVWKRRHPEGWKGHLVRPEVLAAIFLGTASAALRLSRPTS